jgi:hypothetical protein
MSDPHVDWLGKSGAIYRYYFVDISKPIAAVGANYAYVQLMANGNFWPLYFGETVNAKTRPLGPGHERWDEAIAAGITHVMGHPTPGGETVRRAEEQDLIEFWQPVLNIQHRQAK